MTGRNPETAPPRVFISYAQHAPAHTQAVLTLAHALAADGIGVELDQFHQQQMLDWPRWCEERLRPEESDFVLMVCTGEYRRRIENRVDWDQGRGVFWEGRLIYNAIYRDKANARFVPVLLGDESGDAIPEVMQGWTFFRLGAFGLAASDPGYVGLLRFLTGQPAHPRPDPGPPSRLPPEPPPALDARPAQPAAGQRTYRNLPAADPADPTGGARVAAAALDLLLIRLAELAPVLGVAAGVTATAEVARAVLGWLADPAQAGWLLILDNLDDPAVAVAADRLLATLPGGHLLMTGRLGDWPPQVAALGLDVLDLDSAAEFLLERTAGRRPTVAGSYPATDTPLAHELAGELDGLALALEQAAAYIRRQRLGFTEYLGRWRRAERVVREWHDPRVMGYPRPLAATWQASIDFLPASARALLDLIAWLGPEPLPRFLFDHGAAPAGWRRSLLLC